ncbi:MULTISPECIES: serine/threonine-protein kinase [Pyrococcus]|uniref:Serine/threonine-protein kinase n=1 Tax=Pyrococcus furiosus COM1 TaxID=1185654 RepID=I6UXU7_9EURY|nr:serine/threonine-protein kinase [Pyrococcus furiosus]AFN03445.1 serine/threonine-protein kinase [Pyrococcus furiosus COM1]
MSTATTDALVGYTYSQVDDPFLRVQNSFVEPQELNMRPRTYYYLHSTSQPKVFGEYKAPPQTQLTQLGDIIIRKNGGNPLKRFPSDLLGKYRPLEVLGEGGFAEVYKVVRKNDGKIVAIKVPRINQGTSKLFIKEVSIWLHLNHPNIVRLYDADILPIPHLEMEYVEGVKINGKIVRNLDEYPKPMREDIALKIIKGIAEGLKHAHSRGIYHLDLKPLNILLTRDLTPKITDWGLAKIAVRTFSGSISGYTPLYAAPEQLAPSKYGGVDERTDVWQIGVIFYELLTGKLPFDGYTYEEIRGKIVDEGYNFKPPSTFSPKLAKYNKIFEKLLAKKKENRYQTIPEFLTDLKELEINKLKTTLSKRALRH